MFLKIQILEKNLKKKQNEEKYYENEQMAISAKNNQ